MEPRDSKPTSSVREGDLSPLGVPRERMAGLDVSRYDTIESGRGTPLVLMHGMMGFPENWRGLFNHLPEDCHAIALRFPFFKKGVSLDSVPGVTDYAERFLQERDLQKVVLGGNSLGGHVALNLALRQSERVCGLVLTGSSGLFERTFRQVSPHPPRQWFRDTIGDIFYDRALATEELIDWVIEILTVRGNVRDLVKIAKSAKRDHLADRLGDIRCPVLLVWGREDDITPPNVAEEFHRLLGDSELLWLDNCKHAPMLEHPQAFAEAVGDWWERKIRPQLRDAEGGSG